MTISRALSVTAGFLGIVCVPAASVAQQAQPPGPTFSIQSPVPASRTAWMIDANYNAASRIGADTDCAEMRAQAKSADSNVSCTADSRVPAWSVGGGLMFFERAGFRVGYLDYGDIALHASGDTTVTAGPPAGQEGRINVINTTFRYDAELGRARGITLVGVARAPIGRVVPFVEAGVWRWWVHEVESSQFALTINGRPLDTAALSDERQMASWDPVLSGGAEVWLTKMMAVSLGVRFVRLRTADEDVNERFAGIFFGVRVNPRR
jgi:hypothetical protein